MLYSKRSLGAFRICMIVLALVPMMASPAFSQSNDLTIVSSEQSIADGIFDGAQSGMLLWAKTEKFCKRLEAISPTRSGSDTTLFYANEAQARFYEGTCAGSCSLADENSVLRECAQALGAGGCLLYAAARNGKIYDLTVSAEGKPLSQVCN